MDADKTPDERLNDLCTKYRATRNAGEKGRLMGEMLVLGEEVLKPTVRYWQLKLGHAEDIHADKFHDAMQDLIKRAADTPNNASTYVALLRGSVYNAMMDVTRKIKRRKSLLFSEGPQSPEDRIIGREQTPEHLSEDLPKMQARVMAAVENLPTVYLAAFMGILEGNSYEAIAQTENVPIGTVRSRIHRVRAVLNALPEYADYQHELATMPLEMKMDLAGQIRSGFEALLKRRAESPASTVRP